MQPVPAAVRPVRKLLWLAKNRNPDIFVLSIDLQSPFHRFEFSEKQKYGTRSALEARNPTETRHEPGIRQLKANHSINPRVKGCFHFRK